MKEALVIVHADERIVSSVGPDESYRLKNAISERVSSYLFMGKPVLCVPYSQLCGEAPSYLPRDMRHAMETVLVSPSDGSDIIGMHFVPMQALKVRQILLWKGVLEFEIGGLYKLACVKTVLNGVERPETVRDFPGKPKRFRNMGIRGFLNDEICNGFVQSDSKQS